MTSDSTSFRQIRDLLLLFLWGAFVLRFAALGQLSTYLHPTLQPYTIAAGVVLIILAAFALRALITKKGAEACCDHGHDHEEEHAHDAHEKHVHEEHSHAEEAHEEEHHHECCHHDHDHGHSHHHEEHSEEHAGHHHEEHAVAHGAVRKGRLSLIFKTFLLLIPLAMICFGQGNHYTMNTLMNRGVIQDLSKLPAARASSALTTAAPPPATTVATAAADTSSDQQDATNADGSMPAEVIDLLYAVQMPSYRSDFEGKQVEMTAQFVPLSVGNPKGDRFQAVRLFITCCAADAKPVGVTVQYDKPLKISEMGWMKITGIPTFPMEGGRRTAVLMASKVEECPAPAEPFVY